MNFGFGIYQRAKFAVPENPITRAIVTKTANVGVGCVGLGCPVGGLAASSHQGFGDLNTFTSNLTSLNFGALLTGEDFISGIPNVAVLIGGYLALSMFGRGSGYSKDVARLREKHPRGYKRAAKRIRQVAEAVSA